MSYRTVTLGSIAKITSGGTPDRANASYWNGVIPWAKTAQIQNCAITANDIDEWITEKGLKESSAKMVPEGTILMAMYGQGKTRGQVAILGLDAAINQACAAIHLQAGVDRDYVYQQLRFRYESIRGLSNVGGQENLNAELIREIVFPLPGAYEQQAIARCLATWDAAIEMTEKLIKAQRGRLKAITHCTLAPKINERDFRDPIGSLRADRIFENVSRKDFASEPLLSVTQEHGVIPRNMLDPGVTMPTSAIDSFKLVEPGNFVISLRSFQGGIEHSAYRGLVSPAYTVLRAIQPIDERYFRHYFRSADFIKRLSVAVVGIRDGKQISFQDFCSIKIPFPSIEAQRIISETLDTAEQELWLLRNQVAAFKMQKHGLMQKLLIGERQLKSFEREAAE